MVCAFKKICSTFLLKEKKRCHVLLVVAKYRDRAREATPARINCESDRGSPTTTVPTTSHGISRMPFGLYRLWDL